jgi:hypothetical protein
MVLAGTSFVTTLPAPTMAFSPTVRPPHRAALKPMEAPHCTTVGSHPQSASLCNVPSAMVARGNLSLMNVTLCPIKTLSSMVTPSLMYLTTTVAMQKRFAKFAAEPVQALAAQLRAEQEALVREAQRGLAPREAI